MVYNITVIRASVDGLCRDDTGQISRDPRTKRFKTRLYSYAFKMHYKSLTGSYTYAQKYHTYLQFSFIPLAFEALGGMSEATTTSLSRIGRLLGQRLGVSPADSIHHLFSVSLRRGNAALWLHRFPIGPPSIDSII